MTDPGPIRLTAASPQIAPVLELMNNAFAYMEGRIDPPSSLARMTVETLAKEAAIHELWIIPGPRACVLLSPKPDHLYLGKLAVADADRGKGLSRRLVQHAETRAWDLGLPELRLQVRVELKENHAAFAHMGFRQIGETAHPGFDRPTSLTFAKPV